MVSGLNMILIFLVTAEFKFSSKHISMCHHLSTTCNWVSKSQFFT